MKLVLIISLLVPTGALAERVDCTLAAPCPEATVCVTKPVPLNFAIDRSHFAAAIDVNEPPRRAVTIVTLGAEEFRAEPMLIGDVRGFWQDSEAMTDRIFTMQADGRGVYSETPSGLKLAGPCVVTQ